MENSKKKSMIIALIILWLIVSTILYIKFFSHNSSKFVDNTNTVTVKKVLDKTWKEQIISKSVEVINTKKIKKAQSELKIPKDYNSCKEDTNILWCIVFKDKEKNKPKKFVDNAFIVSRLDEISNFKKELLKLKTIKNRETLVWDLADDLQVYYTMTNPAMIFDKFSCKDELCKDTIIKTKKVIVWRMISRQKIDKSKCERIPELEVKNFCLETLEN